MCGLVGVAGDLYKKDVDAFTDLLWVDALRGMDSTGVAGITKGDVKIVKCLGPTSELFERAGIANVITMNKKVLLGHNRSATVGQTSRSNAHPFEFDSVVGAHNGTVDFDSKKRMHRGSEFGTDSEAIYCNIDQFGIDDTIPKLDGAWALTFFDRNLNTLNFIRNDKRQLHYAFSDTGRQIYWASEIGMLMWILHRNGIKTKDDKYHFLPENTLVSWKVPMSYVDVFEENERRVIEGFKKPPVHTQPVGNVRHFGYQGRNENASSVSTVSLDAKNANDSKGNNSAESSQKALAAFRLMLLEKREDWWEYDDIISMPIQVNAPKDSMWGWREDETATVWFERVVALLENGWEWEDENATLLSAPKGRTSYADHPGVVNPVFNSGRNRVWNPHSRMWVALPYVDCPMEWDDTRLQWSFRQSLPLFTSAENKTKSPVGQILDEQEKFQRIKRKLEEGKRLTKHEQQYIDGVNEEPWVDGANVVPLNSRVYVNPVTKKFFTKAEFETVTKEGCDWGCGARFKWGDKVIFHKDQDNNLEAFCAKCADDPMVKQYVNG